MLRKSCLIIFSIIFFSHAFLTASPVINTEDNPPGRKEMNELIPDHQPTRSEIKALKKNEMRLVRFEKVMARMNKMSASGSSKHSGGLFTDPVNRWFWLWIITWGAGILLLVVSAGALTSAAIGILWLLAFTVGSIALILWLVKKFG